MKRFQKLAVLCAVCALLTGTAVLPCEPAAAKAAYSAAGEVVSDGVVYTVYADHAEVSRYDGESAAVTVPQTVQGLPVTVIADGAFSGTLVRHVELPDTVIKIGAEAFAECERLVVCTFPDALTDIGRDAFRGTFWLTKQQKTGEPVVAGHVLIDAKKSKGVVRLSNGITAIAPGAFSGNTELTGVRIPAGVTSIGKGVFSGCTALTKLDLPKSVRKIPEEMCAGCTSLMWIHLPDTLTEIGAGAFRDSGVNYIVLPDSVTEIAPETFSGCKSLYGVRAWEVRTVGRRAFAECGHLTDLEYFFMLEEIGEEAFADCIDLFAFQAEFNLKSIGQRAFRNCTRLENVVLEESVTSIGSEAFAGCSSLKTAMIFGILTEFGKRVFPDLPELEMIAYAQTTVEKYAEENGLKCSLIGEIPPRKLGDIDGDGFIGLEDTQFALKVYTERLSGRKYELPERLEACGDINGDGALTVEDVQYMLRFYTEYNVAHKLIEWYDILNSDLKEQI